MTIGGSAVRAPGLTEWPETPAPVAPGRRSVPTWRRRVLLMAAVVFGAWTLLVVGSGTAHAEEPTAGEATTCEVATCDAVAEPPQPPATSEELTVPEPVDPIPAAEVVAPQEPPSPQPPTSDSGTSPQQPAHEPTPPDGEPPLEAPPAGVTVLETEPAIEPQSADATTAEAADATAEATAEATSETVVAATTAAVTVAPAAGVDTPLVGTAAGATPAVAPAPAATPAVAPAPVVTPAVAPAPVAPVTLVAPDACGAPDDPPGVLPKRAAGPESGGRDYVAVTVRASNAPDDADATIAPSGAPAGSSAPPAPPALPLPRPAPAPAPAGSSAAAASSGSGCGPNHTQHDEGVFAVLHSGLAAMHVATSASISSAVAGSVVGDADDPGVRPG